MNVTTTDRHPPPPQAAAPTPQATPRLGHSAWLFGLPLKARLLIAAHLGVLAAGLEDEELVAQLGAVAGWHQNTIGLAEVILDVCLFLIWGGLTLGWVRLARNGTGGSGG